MALMTAMVMSGDDSAMVAGMVTVKAMRTTAAMSLSLMMADSVASAHDAHVTCENCFSQLISTAAAAAAPRHHHRHRQLCLCYREHCAIITIGATSASSSWPVPYITTRLSITTGLHHHHQQRQQHHQQQEEQEKP